MAHGKYVKGTRKENMVTFRLTAGGYDVFVDGQFFGRLMKGVGFFTDSDVVREYMVISPIDLYAIAMKADEVKNHGSLIPVCPYCKGTPSFPGSVYNPNEGVILCQDSIHQFNIRNFGYLWTFEEARRRIE